jgi:AcrR family transcriptional regulator
MSTHVQDRTQSVRPKREGAHVAEMQRRRLLLAIGEVVAKSGLEAANVGHICEQAGVSRRTFYEIFDDREACLLVAFDRAVERIGQSVRAAYEAPVKWRDRVRAGLTVLLEQLDAEPDIARLCVIETPRAGPEVSDRRKRVLDALAVAVDEGRGESRAGSEPPPLTGQGVVGGALSVIHARLLESAEDANPCSLVELAGPLMGMIVHPYLGAASARRELERPAPMAPPKAPHNGADPFKGLPIRFTYRTARVLATIAANPGASNRHIADHAGITDEGQTSRLLGRLSKYGLIENLGVGPTKGEPNAWRLTDRGKAIHDAIR